MGLKYHSLINARRVFLLLKKLYRTSDMYRTKVELPYPSSPPLLPLDVLCQADICALDRYVGPHTTGARQSVLI